MKTHVLILLLFTTLLTAGCRQQGHQLPEGILTKKKFISLLKDCQIAESAINLEKIKHPGNTAYTDHLYNAIFKKHQVTPEQFKKNIEYYQARPDELLVIYSRVVDSLSKLQGAVNHARPNP